MPNHFRRLLAVLCFLATVHHRADDVRPRFDLIIRNASIIDGSGKPAFAGDVAVRDGKIAAIGKIDAGSATDEIDAGGKTLAPGFIDVHTHVDSDIHKSPPAENFVRDGVTTIVTGNCGGSVGDVGTYLSRIAEHGAGVNIATLYGHNTVLRAVKGDRKGDLTAEQMDKAKSLVRKAMKEGAVGFSTGLIYNPGQFSPTEEIVELAKVASEYDGIYATHMRSEGTNILKAIDEALQVAREAKIRTEISHFKLPADAAAKLGGSDVTLGRVMAARRQGLDVWLDQYPYTASSTTISTLLPDEYLEEGVEQARKRLNKEPDYFARMLATMVEHHMAKSGRKSLAYVVIASTAAFPQYEGKNVVQIAQMRRTKGGELLADASAGKESPVTMEEQCRAVLEIFKAGNAGCVFHTMNDTEVENIMRNPLVAVASDSGLRVFGVGVPHPRGYGTNTRVLGRYVREKKLFSLEEAVRKMTSMPAATFRFTDRGLIKEGYAADLVIFDPQTVEDRATFDKPHQYPVGLTDVIVNGVPVLRDGKMTGKLPGKPIYGPKADRKPAATE
jgi:N-acyl-D-amino-acid deacylase